MYIRFCGNGHLGFRPYGGSLLRSLRGPAKSKQNALAPPLGTSPRLGVPSLRHCSVGPPRRAIHGPARLPRHPCRGAHCAMPAFGQRGLTGRPRSKASARRPDSRPVSWRDHVSPVGAGLLAKRPANPASM
ncbi:Hypothetical protein PflQ2_5523 [Pseudomonas fluorescens Q2-87]|uniref:Uncharacterized protein n=1 Tax=Pseudomonas fluorescens (strain Q2-87) TaxID=1038922 RepID=J2ERK6_PSEFQ|nr:Hypothetical protein PflQ2_5523 [Pseudomonas fluorescens Q2-87]